MDEPDRRQRAGPRVPYLGNSPNEALLPGIGKLAIEMLRAHAVKGKLVVPPGLSLGLGDNRHNSADSRFWGFVPRANIYRKLALVWWSFGITPKT